MNLTLSEDWLAWGLAIMLGFPLLMVALGELILQLDRREHWIVKVVREVRNWVIPFAALFFLLTRVLQLNEELWPIKVVEALAWMSLIAASLSLVNVLLFSGTKIGSWQTEMPKLFRDLVRTFLIAVGGALVLSQVFNQDLGGLIAALGIGSLVIGLALQDTLGNLFSGVALLFERPFEIGDWLEVDGHKGKVIEVNWRSVHLVTRELEQLIVPNSSLAQATIRNYSRPQSLHIETVAVGFSYNDPPNKVKRVMLETALATPGVVKDPAPIIVATSYDDFAISYTIRLFLADYEQVPSVKNDFVTRIWYAARRHALAMPYPIREVYHFDVPQEPVDGPFKRLVGHLKSLSSLAMVDEAVLEEVAVRQATLASFGRGECPIYQGQKDVKLHFVLSGSAIAALPKQNGGATVVAELGQGDFFGYSALLANEPSPMTITATADLDVVILETDAVQKMLNTTPRFAQQMGSVIAARQSKLKELNAAPAKPDASLMSPSS
jgi:small-conductance mechanosensitive channel